jgi:hypothetical protein
VKITVESTTKMVEVNGIPARVWEGTTASGHRVHCFITRIACGVDDAAARREFDRELQECRVPSADIAAAYPLRMIL